MNKSLSTAIHRRVLEAFQAGSITKSGFAENVSLNAPASAGLKQINKNMPQDEYFAGAESNLKMIWRKINRETKEFHVDLFIPILLSLPDPFRSYLLNDIRAEMPSTIVSNISNNEAIKELSEATTAIAVGNKDEQLKELYEAHDATASKIAELLAEKRGKE